MTRAAHNPEEKSDSLKSLFTTILWGLFIAYMLRVFVFQPFRIPSASMEPNLIAGDHIITSKYSLGYGKYAADPLPFPAKNGRWFEREPRRGDVIVFRVEGYTDHYVKRLVGLPGDRIQMIAGILYINNQPSPQTETDMTGPDEASNKGARVMLETIQGRNGHLTFDEVINNDSFDDTPVFLVPKGHYFMMGDNRDNSLDSRRSPSDDGIGFVPSENIVGKAEFVLLSGEKGFSIIKPWTWGKFRKDRFFKGIK